MTAPLSGPCPGAPADRCPHPLGVHGRAGCFAMEHGRRKCACKAVPPLARCGHPVTSEVHGVDGRAYCAECRE